MANESTPIVTTENEYTDVVQLSEASSIVSATGQEKYIFSGASGPPGPPGEQGPPGSAGALVDSGITGEAIGGHRVIGYGTDGLMYYVDIEDEGMADAVAGISIGAASLGAEVSFQSSGTIIEPSWNWAPQGALFIGAAGTLTQTRPTSGFTVIVGYAVSATKLSISIKQAILKG